MKVELDLTKLNNIGVETAKSEFKEPIREEVEKGTIISLKGLERAKNSPKEQTIEEIETNLAKIKLNQIQEDHERTVQAYKEYQDNIKASECLQAEILKGAKAGEDTSTLFLKACRAIANMTGNKTFYNSVETSIKRKKDR